MSCRCREVRDDLPSLQSSAQVFWIALGMKYSDYPHLGWPFGYNEVNRILPIGDPRCASPSANEPVSGRILSNLAKEISDIASQPLPNAWFLGIIPIYSLLKFIFSFSLDDEVETHFAERNRSSISRKTSSKGLPRSGWAKACSARRSSSANCSGVSSDPMLSDASPNSSMIKSTRSRCSSGGNPRILSRISAALMEQVYLHRGHKQAGFSIDGRAASS